MSLPSPEEMDALVARELERQGFVGASVGVMREGEVLLAQGYGLRRIDPPAAATAETRFAIGSVTKQFTCAAVLKLAEDGKLGLDDPVSKYLPQLTSADRIDLRDLMHHVSGYPDYYPLDFLCRAMAQPIEARDLAERYGKGTLDFEPGTQWSYSNTGYTILGLVVEQASGEPFGRFLERRIFEPLGMTDTTLGRRNDARYADGYVSFFLGPDEPALPEADGWIGAAGDIYSTGADLMKWDRALMAGEALAPESYRIFLETRKLANGGDTGYACGVTRGKLDGVPVIAHNGAVSGFRAVNLMFPETRSAIAVLANKEGLKTDALVRALLPRLASPEPQAPAPAAAERPPVQDVPKVAGESDEALARRLLAQILAGALDRSLLGEEFDFFMTPERVARTASVLGPLGEPLEVEIVPAGERGGMTVGAVRFTFADRKAAATLFRTPDGKVQQFLLYQAE